MFRDRSARFKQVKLPVLRSPIAGGEAGDLHNPRFPVFCPGRQVLFYPAELLMRQKSRSWHLAERSDSCDVSQQIVVASRPQVHIGVHKIR